MRKFLVLIALAVGATALIAADSLQSGEDVARHWAEVRHLNVSVVLQNYQDLTGTDYEHALTALSFFEKQDAFEIAAASLRDVRIGNISGELIHLLARTPNPTSGVITAALRELETLNNIEYRDDGERTAGTETMKSNLATLVAKWMDMADPKLLSSRAPDTRPEYAAFIARAKEKIARNPLQ
jgi:hypothetical protein